MIYDSPMTAGKLYEIRKYMDALNYTEDWKTLSRKIFFIDIHHTVDCSSISILRNKCSIF